MKTVAKLYNWGYIVGSIWMVIWVIRQLFGTYEYFDPSFVYASHLPLLILDLSDLLLVTAVKILFTASVICYIHMKVSEYEKEKEEVKY